MKAAEAEEEEEGEEEGNFPFFFICWHFAKFSCCI